MRIVCLGDSLTYGYMVPRKDTWVSHVGREYGKHELINKGINGDTSGGMLARLQEDVIKQQAQMAIIMGGSNDIIMRCGISQCRANCMAMVNQLVYHKIKPVLGIPTLIDENSLIEEWAWMTDAKEANKQLREYRKWILDFCKIYKIEYIDFQHTIEAEGQKDIYLDGLHLNKKGHHVMAEKVLNFFNERNKQI